MTKAELFCSSFVVRSLGCDSFLLLAVKGSFHLTVIVFLFGLFAGSAWAGGEALRDRVVIVVNERDPESLEVGRHYAERRGIPQENILAIDAPTAETISRREFLESVRNPLERLLFEGGWLDGMFSRLKDANGYHRSVIEGHRISYLVLCRGVPLRIRHDPSLVTAEMERDVQEEFRTNAAAVDSELALLMWRAPIIGFVRNPLFGNRAPTPQHLNGIVKVARLDGPTAEDAKALVDSAIEGEKKGVRGRAYVDLTGPHADGKKWLEETAGHIRELGFDLDFHEPRGIFPVDSRFDAPALYFGWYANDVGGPFLLEDFRFPPGAIALHIHSYSARTVRSTSEGWVGPLVARGAAVTLGNVYEPYLELSHRPSLFFEWVRHGGNVGDAAAYAMRGFSWQGILVGDPLYQPFAMPLEEQLKGEGDPWSGYAVIRRMNLLSAEGKGEEALELGLAALDRDENLALVVSVANLQVEAGERRQAARTLLALERLPPSSFSEVVLAKKAADLLGSLNEHERAFKVYERLLSDSRLPDAVRKTLLEDGVLLANRLGKRSQTREWRSELSKL